MAGRIEIEAEKLVLNLLAGTEYELVDLEYVKERDWYLRIFIDKKDGVDLDDCQGVSRMIDDELEKSGLLKESYILEVSSPGIDRPLKKDRDFEREMGKQVDVTAYKKINGAREIIGRLSAFSADAITLDDSLIIPRAQIASVRLHIEF
ncbi:ribosome maturation factor RimP [Pectinatus haikarae]|uniref:Ribosome maturation factor RimP n=1 Tax=Pectinatus haikarae TaxID=349096 RepID=A0ABT9Y8H2_9FIRM|nr:ribosome maturation factor RimP [Pectinatus haikarae]MDQ0203444.1 ribosome maturation factor RimP [Pectinatus haikarae]